MDSNMKEKQAVIKEYRSRYHEAKKKEKRVMLDEFTKLTVYHRKSTFKVLSCKPVRELTVYGHGRAVKLKLGKSVRRTGRASESITDEVIASLRLAWTFFWYECGKILVPLMRQRMECIARWLAFNITYDIAGYASTTSSIRLATELLPPSRLPTHFLLPFGSSPAIIAVSLSTMSSLTASQPVYPITRAERRIQLEHYMP
ncbi:MAG: hypothetical protein LBH18_08045 [Spirochaetaceae bacterium]|jgi:hypothetical protein|nr:hypothetical protein [Spirochaetaceae bacterium]